MGMERLLPFAGMVMAILIQAGSLVLNKAAMSKGVNKYTMIVYANALSTLLLLPFSFVVHRPSVRPPLTFPTLCRLFLLGLFGCSAQIFAYVGVDYSSPMLGTAMLNLIPAFTFLLAIIFRMENVYWKRSSSQAKILGTITSITGAFVVTLYKGPPVLDVPSSPTQFLFSLKHSNWIAGGLFLAADAFFTSLWYILQALTVEKYPAVVFIVFFQCLFTTILSAAFALIAIKDANAWQLRLDMGLIAILYTGIISTVLRYSLVTWCVWKAGAVYCSMFKPLAIIFGVIMGFIFLGDSVYLVWLVQLL
ncbi:WAT1-related protein At5g40240-like isoform X2 [Argentina anserina]|uniref:WAT1-related protein At5g40240-like isoform X2 n=1 Tax=Argentina anserina TaxID=57926 RepID=UPI00217668F1|nr:WAT1-related protein At5g40240-like isoform X2 [Potentilla anserina]